MQPTIKKFLIALMVLVALCVITQPAWASPPPPTPSTFLESMYDEMMGTLCFACPAFSQFYQGGLMLAVNFSMQIADGVFNLLAVVFGVWLLWQIAKIFTPFGPMGGISEIFNAITSKLVLFVFLLTLLGNFGQIWSWVLSPIFNTGIGLSSAMLQATANSMNAVGGLQGGSSNFLSNVTIDSTGNCAYARTLTFQTLSRINYNQVGGGLTQANFEDPLKRLVCNIQNVQAIYASGIVLGLGTFLYAGSDTPAMGLNIIGNTITYVVKVVLAFVVGISLAVIYLIALLVYPLYLVDALFKFIVVTVIAPILVAAYFLPMTRSWATAGIKALVGVAATIFFLSLIVGLSLAMMSATIIEMSNTMGNSGQSAGNITAAAGALFRIMPVGLLGIFLSKEFWMIYIGFMVAGVISILLTRKAGELAREFTGSSAGDGVMGAMVQGVKTAAMVGVAAATGGAALGAKGLAVANGLRQAKEGPPDDTTPATKPDPFGPDAGGTGSNPAGGKPGGGLPGIASGFIPRTSMGGSAFTSGNTTLSGNFDTSQSSQNLDFLGGAGTDTSGGLAYGSTMTGSAASGAGQAQYTVNVSPGGSKATGDAGTKPAAGSGVSGGAGGGGPSAGGLGGGGGAPASVIGQIQSATQETGRFVDMGANVAGVGDQAAVTAHDIQALKDQNKDLREKLGAQAAALDKAGEKGATSTASAQSSNSQPAAPTTPGAPTAKPPEPPKKT